VVGGMVGNVWWNGGDGSAARWRVPCSAGLSRATFKEGRRLAAFSFQFVGELVVDLDIYY